MDNLEDFTVCHCVSKDCSNCPVRNVGTGSLAWIHKQQLIRKGKIMPIRTPTKEKKFNKPCCGNCFMAYKTRFDHNTVIRCKEWNNKVVTEGETCDKHAPILSNEGIPEE